MTHQQKKKEKMKKKQKKKNKEEKRRRKKEKIKTSFCFVLDSVSIHFEMVTNEKRDK